MTKKQPTSCLPFRECEQSPITRHFRHQLGGKASQQLSTETGYSTPRSLPRQQEPVQGRPEKKGKNPEDSTTTPVKPQETTWPDGHSDTVPVRRAQDHLRTESAMNSADFSGTKTFDLCHLPDTTPGLDFFTDPLFCEALFKVSLDLLPLMFNSSNYNNCNSDIKSLNCFSGVVNLSDHQLSDGELSLLQKGLTFVDTPPSPDLGVLCEDFSKFHLSIKRKLALSGLNLTTTPEIPRQGNNLPFQSRKFTNRSNWNPPAPGIVEHMHLLNESALQNSLLSPKLQTFRRNLTKAEIAAKSSLQHNHDIVIKKADKGSNVVIQNKTDYINEGLKQLSDRKFYRLQEESLTHHHNTLIKKAIDEMVHSKEITPKTADYLFLENPRTSKFYLLPKIHKNKLPPPGRPIVSANECPSERISQFVDNFIQPIVKTLPAYLRDSSHLLNIIRHLQVPPGAILANLDVTSLCTNIPNDEGILAVSRYLFKYRDASLNPTNHSICKLLDLVLKTNNFEFDNKEFRQVGRAAIGT